MLKRLTLAVAALFVLSANVFAAGTIPGFSLAYQPDSDGTPLAGCKLYTIQAGTTSTPQTAYQDSDLTLPLPYPVLCDAYGRLPQIFLADGSIKLRLTKANGTQVFVLDGVLVVGASSGGGGGSPVDPTTIIATGDLKVRYGTGSLTGFVRANGRTIGSATSGATERANADCQSLFEYLWTTDSNLAVSTGRGASANADWVANKTIALPDWRGRALAALDDMGNSAAGRLTATYFGTAATVLGAASTGAESRTLVTTNLPPYTPSGTIAGTITMTPIQAFNGTTFTGSGGPFFTNPAGTNYANFSPTGTFSGSFTGSAQGGTSTPLSIVQPTMLATIYIKL